MLLEAILSREINNIHVCYLAQMDKEFIVFNLEAILVQMNNEYNIQMYQWYKWIKNRHVLGIFLQ